MFVSGEVGQGLPFKTHCVYGVHRLGSLYWCLQSLNIVLALFWDLVSLVVTYCIQRLLTGHQTNHIRSLKLNNINQPIIATTHKRLRQGYIELKQTSYCSINSRYNVRPAYVSRNNF